MTVNIPTFICGWRDRLRNRCFSPRVSVGVYVAQEAIHYAVLHSAGESRVVRETGSVRRETLIPFAECLKHCLEQVAERIGKAGFSFSLGFSNDTLRVLPVELPPLSREDAKKAFAFELSKHFPFDAQEAVHDILSTGCFRRESGLFLWMAAAMPLSLAREAVEAADAAGSSLRAIEPVAFAILRYVEGINPSGTSARMHIFVREESAFVLGVNAGRMAYFRMVNAGRESLSDSLVSSACSFEKLLAGGGAIELCLSASSIGKQEVFTFKQALESALSRDIGIHDPWREWGISEFGMDTAAKGKYEIPVALALRL